VSIPNALTAFIIGYNGERIRKLHQLTGAYIFVPKDYNTLTDERIIQLSGNEKSVEFCKKEIKFIVARIAPLLDIKLDEFKRNKKNIKFNFEKLIEEKKSAMTTVPNSLARSPDNLHFMHSVKTEAYIPEFRVDDPSRRPNLLESAEFLLHHLQTLKTYSDLSHS